MINGFDFLFTERALEEFAINLTLFTFFSL